MKELCILSGLATKTCLQKWTFFMSPCGDLPREDWAMTPSSPSRTGELGLALLKPCDAPRQWGGAEHSPTDTQEEETQGLHTCSWHSEQCLGWEGRVELWAAENFCGDQSTRICSTGFSASRQLLQCHLFLRSASGIYGLSTFGSC